MWIRLIEWHEEFLVSGDAIAIEIGVSRKRDRQYESFQRENER